MNLFLDTDICIAILRGKEPALEKRLAKNALSSVLISSVVVAELWVGARKAASPRNAEHKLSALLRGFQSVAFDDEAARKYGEIRSQLEKRGTAIGANDLLIAATALVHEGKLITRNLGEFRRVPGLEVEAW